MNLSHQGKAEVLEVSKIVTASFLVLWKQSSENECLEMFISSCDFVWKCVSFINVSISTHILKKKKKPWKWNFIIHCKNLELHWHLEMFEKFKKQPSHLSLMFLFILKQCLF